MAKVWYIILSLTAVSAGLFGTEQDRLLAEFGSFPVRGTIDEFEVVQELQGGVYVLYIADGQFSVIRGDRDGNFDSYEVPGLEAGFQNPRNLSVNPPGFTEYAAFMADKMGARRIYIFRVDHFGNLFCADLLEAGGSDQQIGFTLGESYTELCNVYIAADGVLSYFSGAGSGDRQPIREGLSRYGERVDRYGIIKKPDANEHYGWYSVVRDAGVRDIVFFLIKDNGLIIRKTLTGYTEQSKITNTVNIYGDIEYTVIDDTVIHDQGAVLFKGTGDDFIPIAAFEEADRPQISFLTEIPENTSVDFMVLNQNQYINIFERDGYVWSAVIDKTTNTLEPDSMAPVDQGRRLSVKQEADKIRMSLINESRASLVIHEYDGSGWNKITDIPLPDGIEPAAIGIEPGISDNPFLSFLNILYFGTGNKFIVGDIHDETWHVITGRRRIWGRIINGFIFLVVHMDDLLTVYRMGGAES
ncbi:MAG: hypothetical protein LBQ38_10560 [Spirochaetaceae bacterium]|nr:hypothetical protein [Spirochaetaceae bacterium]